MWNLLGAVATGCVEIGNPFSFPQIRMHSFVIDRSSKGTSMVQQINLAYGTILQVGRYSHLLTTNIKNQILIGLGLRRGR